MKTAVVFGAGSIGRGFIGGLLVQAGWHVTFVDVAESLVVRLNVDGGYNQVIVDPAQERTVWLAPVDAILLSDRTSVIEVLTRADLAATAVGAHNLEPVASLIAHGITMRRDNSRPPLDVLLCENLHNAASTVREMVAQRVGAEEADGVGLIETSIGRMVPVPVSNPADPTQVRVEPYSFLPYDATALLGSPPDVPGLIPVTDGFALYGDRKLYVHNMGHCMLAFFAELRDQTYVWQTVEDLGLRYLVRNAMAETAIAIAERYTVPAGPLLQHVDDLLTRFGNRRLADTAERVGRDPVRKMEPQDRLLGSYLLCRAEQITPSHVSLGVALGARRLAAEEGWDDQRIREYLDRHLFEAEPDARLRDQLHQQIESIRNGLDVRSLIQALDQSHLPSRII